jgi:polysaccharide biosynthesis/export protein
MVNKGQKVSNTEHRLQNTAHLTPNSNYSKYIPMRTQTLSLIIILILAASCTSQKKLAYLQNLPEPSGQESFPMEIPDYKLQPRDILYITAKAMTPDGSIRDYLSTTGNVGSTMSMPEAGGALFGYNIDSEGNISIPGIGFVKVSGLKLEETREKLQELIEKVYLNTTVECKLLSFKFTVIGEVKAPGAYVNYNNYLTVLEAIGRAGGIGDFGNRDRALVVRPYDKGTKTFRINLQDKNLLSSEAYFLLPNDVVIVEPMKQKIFNMNLPTIAFIISTFTSTVTMTILLINYSGK